MARTRIPILLMGLVLWCCLNTPVKSKYLKYKDLKQPIPVRIQDLLDRMTLEEKIGQMVQIECRVASAEVMKKYLIGEQHPSHSIYPVSSHLSHCLPISRLRI
ncbi:hypothetical protein HRI_004558600 [Hibiscus trionum]|uniref:Glycoside hydrolase family 3 N-terminal domain-containing protein n=1 Tax=Hibiscus trionum TaxID=183268 RepID=A0A9W7JBW2_HIBTR|nr:hypothetical protein HRI_004558600 [Hibiscus trionum]